jgi:hypothetical protein
MCVIINDAKGIEYRYAKLPKDVTDILTLENIKSNIPYNKELNRIDFLWPTAHFVFDFLMILLDVPAFIWYGWSKILYQNGNCFPYTIWM